MTSDETRLDRLLLRTLEWHVQAFNITTARSSYFSDRTRFPAGTVEFDHALVMGNILHEWHQAEDSRNDRTGWKNGAASSGHGSLASLSCSRRSHQDSAR